MDLRTPSPSFVLQYVPIFCSMILRLSKLPTSSPRRPPKPPTSAPAQPPKLAFTTPLFYVGGFFAQSRASQPDFLLTYESTFLSCLLYSHPPFVEAARGRLPLWLCSDVAMWLCSHVAVWLCGYVSKFPSSKVSNFTN